MNRRQKKEAREAFDNCMVREVLTIQTRRLYVDRPQTVVNKTRRSDDSAAMEDLEALATQHN